MLYLHQSNYLEHLSSHFSLLQKINPLPPLDGEVVVVQNNGMARWLSLQMATVTGIAANLRFLFPAELTWELLRKVLKDVPEKDPCAPTFLRWRLYDLFLREGEYWQELAHYLGEGEVGTWQLSAQLSKVLDQYLFFRPEWIRAWERDETLTDDWQAILWRKVTGNAKLPHWVRLQDEFGQAVTRVDIANLPKRIIFFSVPVLSPGYVQLIAQIAQHIDVHFYLMNPSQEYWGDIESEKRKQKRPLELQALVDVGNPLLASWGRQGRDFLDLLIDANAETDEDSLFILNEESNRLQRLQADILYLREPMFEGQNVQDDSIQFHACHSPMREAEVLYQHLLKLFANNPTLTPADIVVMVPDIDTYAPYLDAVFSAADPALPFSIADSSPRFAQGILNLCDQLLELPQTRCDTETLLALLEFDEVRKQLELDEAQVMQCREWIREVNIRWGAEENHRVEQGGAATSEHTWRYGLDRLLLGYAMPGEELFEGILPYNYIEGSQAEVLGRLQSMLDALFELANWANQHCVFAEWDERFRRLLQTVVGEDAPLQSVWQALDNLQKTLQTIDFNQPLPWAIFKSALQEQLDKRSESEGFLGRGITFCALMPMRTVPFRFVGLIGMNDGVFPRRDVHASFDRMALTTRRGDRLKRDEDRYLFLESVLSAREWLYVSYVGRSQQDNKELPPSVLVSELLDYLERCGAGKRHELIKQHDLQGFTEFMPHYRGRTSAEFLGLNEVLPDPEIEPPESIALEELIRFYQNPARAFLRQRFGLYLGESIQELPTREPFELEGYTDSDIREYIFQQLQKDKPLEQALPLLRAQGLLPHGKLGDLLFEQEAAIATKFYGKVEPLPKVRNTSFSLLINEIMVHGTIDQLDADGRKIYLLNPPSYWHWLDIWLKHLALNGVEKDLPSFTYIYTPEKDYVLNPVTNAEEELQRLIQWYKQGLVEPLLFFPKSALALMESKKREISSALGKWLSNGSYVGEGDKPEYRLLYRQENPLETHAAAFIEMAEKIFQPMFNARSS